MSDDRAIGGAGEAQGEDTVRTPREVNGGVVGGADRGEGGESHVTVDEAALEQLWKKTLPPGADWNQLETGGTYKPAPYRPALRPTPGTAVAPLAAGDRGGRPTTAASTTDLAGVAPVGVSTIETPALTVEPGREDSTVRVLHDATAVMGPVVHHDPGASLAHANYELLEEIGRGGMGVVHRARQVNLDRDVAIKRIRTSRARPGARERFVQEAQVTGQLDHPNIVPVHDLGDSAGGEVFLAMKLVGGRSWLECLHEDDAENAARESGAPDVVEQLRVPRFRLERPRH